MNKIAILTDSCCDVPQEYISENIYVVPLEIHYSDGIFYDKVDITPDDVYKRFNQEIPKTSLPSGEAIKIKIDEIIKAGYDELVVITISSGLSGTFNIISLILQDYPMLKYKMLDTLSIGIGAGMSVIRANELISAQKSLDEIEQIMQRQIKETKVYFCVSVLKYLQRGGRIGLVSAALGTMLDLKPIISCNSEGVYYTHAKQRGRKKALSLAIDIVTKELAGCTNYNIAIVNGDASEEAIEIKQRLNTLVTNAKHTIEGQISPALVVHTGPGLIGICLQRIVED